MSKKIVAKNKTITKCCPFCEMHVAVACKTCPGCQQSLVNAKKGAASVVSTEPTTTMGLRRRTERVRREKPHFYDASEFERKPAKKRRSDKSLDAPIKIEGRGPGRPPNHLRQQLATAAAAAASLALKRKKKKAKPVKQTINSNTLKRSNNASNNNKDGMEAEEPLPALTGEKGRQCSIILAELNRKFMTTAWRI